MKFKSLIAIIVVLISSMGWAQDSIPEPITYSISLVYSQGDELILDGEGFGDIPGQVKLCNVASWNKKAVCKNMTALAWSDAQVIFRLDLPSIKMTKKEGALRYLYVYVLTSKKEPTSPGVKLYLKYE